MDRKLDAAIADALGYEVVNGWAEKVENGLLDRKEIPKYSTDGNAMLELDREMRNKGYSLVLGRVNMNYTALYQGEEKSEMAFGVDSMPLAVALAAHYVLTGEEWTSID
jgi:hypothetical protein